jgi:hypothetical protein
MMSERPQESCVAHNSGTTDTHFDWVTRELKSCGTAFVLIRQARHVTITVFLWVPQCEDVLWHASWSCH